MILPGRTVFVLGAGAGVPYGLPPGDRLRQLIIKQGQADNLSSALVQSATAVAGCDASEVIELARAFAVAGTRSIDRWVASNPRFVRLAKALIAGLLLERERDRYLLPGGSKFNADEDWIGYLLEHAVQDNGEVVDGASFVTFNVDRTLERRVSAMFQGRFGMVPEVADDRTRALTLVRVAGTLGRPDGFSSGTPDERVEFGAEPTPGVIDLAVRQMRFVFEQRAATDLARASSLIDAADLVVFLGFGFDPLNVRYLDIDPGRPRIFIATGYGLSSAEGREIELSMRGLRIFEGVDAMTLLRRSRNLHGRHEAPAAGRWDDALD